MDIIDTPASLLEVHELTVEFATRNGTVRAVEHVDLTLEKGSTPGIVGESGSGKSVTSYAVLRILDWAGRIARGSIRFSGVDLTRATEPELQDIRGREISMIFQNPRAALNPIRSVGRQIEDVLPRHDQTTPAKAREAAIEVLRQVRIARPEERYSAYPFQLSGGMCQRIVIAIALACQPRLLIADEPTTGLDVTTQKAVMDLIAELTRERRMSTILITHDLGLAAAYCDRVMVMEKGRVVETATARQVFSAPAHPYTQRLMRATPRPGISVRDLLPRAGCPTGPASGGDEPTSIARGGYAGEGVPRRRVRLRLAGPPAWHAAGGAIVSRGGWHQFSIERRRKRRTGRRVGVWQIDHLRHGDAAAGPKLRRHPAGRSRHWRGAGGGLLKGSGSREVADGVPACHRQPQPAVHRVSLHRRSLVSAWQRRRARHGARQGRGTG